MERRSLWSAALQSGTATEPAQSPVPVWRPALRRGGAGQECPMERRSPERHWETKLLQVAT